MDRWTVWSYLDPDFNKTDESRENKREKKKNQLTIFIPKISIFCALDVFGGSAGHTTTTTSQPVVLLIDSVTLDVYTCVFSYLSRGIDFLDLITRIPLFFFLSAVCLSHSATASSGLDL